ncbi:MAG: hypothetical protein NT154_05545 [Verrucomicrobia bacterium]|nr:hypothetical protein [Verrucomicrobiota bacterium]
MMTQTEPQLTSETPVTALPAPEPPTLTVKVRLNGRDKHQFTALAQFYGVSEKTLGNLAVRHFLDATKAAFPKINPY